MTDITHPTVHGHYAALVNHPGYYYLYALYSDYPISNLWFQEPEHAARLKKRLRAIQPLLALVQPYRKSPALRLFTERAALARFPPEKADEAWRQLRELLDGIGPPARWREADAPPDPDSPQEHPSSDVKSEMAANTVDSEVEHPPEPTEKKDRPKQKSFPKSPVDYTMEV